MTILILGPSEWGPGRAPPLPEWAKHQLAHARALTGRPNPLGLAVRLGLVEALAHEGHAATAVEFHPTLVGEPLMGKLHRLEREKSVDRFYIYWPWGAVRSSLDIEIGHLETLIEHHEITGTQISIFFEDDGQQRRAAELRVTSEGFLFFRPLEKGRRSRYHGDLRLYGATFVPWGDHDELLVDFLDEARGNV